MAILRRTLIVASLVVGLVILTSCGKSSDIQGKWFAQEGSGKDTTIEFTEDTVVVDGEVFDYKQKGVGVKNGVDYVYFEQNGEDYSIIFPDKNKNIAVLIQPNSTEDYLTGEMLYALNKDEQPSYEGYLSKYFK